MNTSTTALPAGKSSRQAAPLQIVLVHNEPSLAVAARTMITSFISKCAADVDVHRDEWSFAELEHPKCKTESLELARDCDILVIAISDAAEFSDSITAWLTEWLQTRNPRDTAVILSSTAFPGLAGYLSSPLMRTRGLSVFSTEFQSSKNLNLSSPPRTPIPFCTYDALPEFSGINE